MNDNSNITLNEEPKILLAVSELYYKDMLNIIIQSPNQEQAEKLKQQILDNQRLIDQLKQHLNDKNMSHKQMVEIFKSILEKQA